MLHILQQLVEGLLSISSMKAKPAEYHRYVQPATVNSAVYSTNRPGKEKSLYAVWQEMRSAIIKMLGQKEDVTENI